MTKGVRPLIAACFKVSRVIDASINTGQRVDTLRHCALMATPQIEQCITLATVLAPLASVWATSAPSNRPDPTIAGVHESGGRAEDMVNL